MKMTLGNENKFKAKNQLFNLRKLNLTCNINCLVVNNDQ